MLEIGKVYRLSRKEKSPDVIEVDGLPNFFTRLRFLMQTLNSRYNEEFMYLRK